MPEAGISVRRISSGKLRIEPTQITAEGGPAFPRLIVPVSLDFNPMASGQQDECFTMLGIECGLFITDYAPKISDAAPITNLLDVRSYSISTAWKLEFPLDPHRVKGLEARRHGDLKLRFDFAFVLGLLTRVVFPDKASRGPVDVLTAFEKTNSQIYVEVPQSHWVGKVLPVLGSNSYFIVEVPTGKQHITSAWTLIEKAESAFGRWDTKAVFAHCREAAKALTSSVEKRHAEKSFLTDQRWDRAVKEFYHFASLDLHLEEIRAKGNYAEDQVRIDKPDAECLLIFVKALAKYAEELIAK